MVKPVDTALDKFIRLDTLRLEEQVEYNRLTPAPASPLAAPVETARSQANQATVVFLAMAPSRDGIFTVGPTSVRVGSAQIKILPASSVSSWGF